MEHIKQLFTWLCVVGLVLLFADLVSAQVVRPRKPNEPVTKAPPEPPVRYQPSPELKNLVEAQGIRDVKVTPGEQDVVITFRARPSVIPVIEISSRRPAQGQGGVLDFSNRLTKEDATGVPNENEITKTGYTATLSGLESGTVYYYIITVPPSDGFLTRQIQGRFTTVKYKTSVTVFFTEIEVTNDSDDGGDGELFFDFYINGDKISFLGYLGMTLSWNDEEPVRQLSPPVTTEIADAPDGLELAVNGFDDDGPLGLKSGLNATGPLAAPFEDTWHEGNVAKQTFNLRSYPGEDHREDFILTSIRQAAGQGDLSFNVKGYFVITRTKIR